MTNLSTLEITLFAVFPGKNSKQLNFQSTQLENGKCLPSYFVICCSENAR